MSEPLQILFGRRGTAKKLLGTAEPVVHHGDPKRLPAFLRTGPLTSVAKLCAAYSGPIQVASGSRDQGLQLPMNATASQALALGLTAYFVDLVGLLDGAGAWLAELEASAGIPRGCVRLMAFSNAPGSGLPPHHDHYDQVLIHLIGATKTLDVRPNGLTENPAMQFRPEEQAPPAFGVTYANGFPQSSVELADGMQTLDLKPGSVVYLPAGCWHCTSGQQGTTLSVVLQFLVPSRLEVMSHAVALWLTQSPAWRSRPYGAWGDGAEAERTRLRDDLQALGAELASMDLERVHEAWSLSQALAGAYRTFPDHVPWERWIRLPEARVSLQPQSISNRLAVEVRLGTQLVPRRTHSLGLPLAHQALVEWILEARRAFTTGELADHFPNLDDIAETLRLLARNEVIRPIPVPALP